MPRLGYWNAHSDLDWYDGNRSPGEAPIEHEPEPDDTYWGSILADAEEQAYRDGWSACMEWLARVPPDGLSAEAREMWCEGYDSAMDAPLGERCP